MTDTTIKMREHYDATGCAAEYKTASRSKSVRTTIVDVNVAKMYWR